MVGGSGLEPLTSAMPTHWFVALYGLYCIFTSFLYLFCPIITFASELQYTFLLLIIFDCAILTRFLLQMVRLVTILRPGYQEAYLSVNSSNLNRF